jgi:hypothetical protein
MIGLAISILWLLIGVIVLIAIIYFAFWAIKSMGVAIPPPIEKMVWIIVVILILIGILTLLVSGGGGLHGPSLGYR